MGERKVSLVGKLWVSVQIRATNYVTPKVWWNNNSYPLKFEITLVSKYRNEKKWYENYILNGERYVYKKIIKFEYRKNIKCVYMSLTPHIVIIHL